MRRTVYILALAVWCVGVLVGGRAFHGSAFAFSCAVGLVTALSILAIEAALAALDGGRS